MRQWKHVLNVKHFYHSDVISIEEKGKLMAKAIMRLPLDKIELYAGDDFEDLIEAFNGISGFEEVTPVEEFDEWMSVLYDYADRYGIWVETI